MNALQPLPGWVSITSLPEECQPCPPAGELHLWLASLHMDATHLPALEAVLSESEQQRAARFLSPIKRNEFRAAHGVLRHVLSLYADRPASELIISGRTGEKPRLIGVPGMEFSMSHAGGALLIGVTRQAALGVDIEALHQPADLQEMAMRMLSPAEKRAWPSLPSKKRAEVFFRVWTRKEAILKAAGVGMQIEPDQLTVPFTPTPAVVSFAPFGGQPQKWYVESLTSIEGFAAAVAVSLDAAADDSGGAARPHLIRTFHWQPDTV